MSQGFDPADPARFEHAIRRFDEENGRDPNTETVDGTPCPRELAYARRLTDWVLRLAPNASEVLRLAARSQHLCRWTIPRERYPMTRAGYLKWRQDLKQFHAQKAGDILAETGYPPAFIARVRSLNLKQDLAADPEAQTLEDALCLVFLERQLGPLAEKTAEDKVVAALQKSWLKMSSRARAIALGLPLGAREKALLEKALKEAGSGERGMPGPDDRQ